MSEKFKEAELAAEVWLTIDEVFSSSKEHANIIQDSSGELFLTKAYLETECNDYDEVTKAFEDLLKLSSIFLQISKDILQNIQIIAKQEPIITTIITAPQCMVIMKAMKSNKMPPGKSNQLLACTYLITKAAMLERSEINPLVEIFAMKKQEAETENA